ncbi:MAG: tetratricopeptide repeat protein [Planctomycetota bacterium]
MYRSTMSLAARFILPSAFCILPCVQAAQQDDAVAWGRENIAAGRYAEAEALLRAALPKLVQDSPEQRAATAVLITALRIQGKLKDALAFCDGLLKAQPDDSAAILLKAELDCETGNYKPAREAYDRVIAREPANERAWALRSLVLRTLGDKQALKKTADHFFDLYESKKTYFNSEDVKDPLELAYIGLGVQDEDPKSAFETAYVMAEELVQARKSDTPEVYLWSARLAHDKYAFGMANDRYKLLLGIRPRLPDGLAGLAAIVLQTMHKLDDVEKLLKDALAVNPNHVESHLLYAAIDLEEDKYEEAQPHLEAALAANPNDRHGLALQAFYYLDTAQPEKAAEIEKRALAINPHCADFYCDLGEMMENKRGFNLAPDYYRKALACDPEHWRGYYGLGMNTSRLGAQGEDEGKVLLNKAFSKNKFNLWAKNMLVALDQIDGARPELGDPGTQAPRYAEVKTKHFILKCFGKEASIVQPYLEEWAESAYKRQKEMFGFEPQGPLTIELCHDMTIQSARTVGLPNLGALGVCFGKLCTVVSPQESKGAEKEHPFDWRKVLEHEFGHVMALQLSAFRVPRWYTEALSTYLEDDNRIESDPMIADAIAHDKLKDLEHMNEYFRTNPLMAYVHGRYVIEYLAHNFGFEAHVKALKLFAEGKKLATVLPQVTGKTLQELDGGQLVFLKEALAELRPHPTVDKAALALLELAANKEDAPAKAIAELARARFAGGHYEIAADLARKALAKDPKCVEALLVLGHWAYERKDYETAKARYLEAVGSPLSLPRGPEARATFPAWLRLGALFKKEGKTSKAIEAFEAARKLHPRYIGPDNPHHELPGLYEELDPPQPEKAMQVWRACVRVHPEDAEASLKGLLIAMKLKDYAAALELAAAHNEVDPYNGEVHRLAGQAAVAMKDYPSAARELGVAVALNHEDVDGWVALARARKELGQLDAARLAVQQALDIDATCKEAKVLREELK